MKPIHPLLGDQAPRWTDATHTKCGCDLCQHWSPLIQNLNDKLDAQGKAWLKELTDDWYQQGEDLSVAQAKLDGSWPGWEAMKDFKPQDL